MGTTLTMAYVLWPRLYVVHAGDSRCYLHRRGQFAQLTNDHTVAQRMVSAGCVRSRRRKRPHWITHSGTASAAGRRRCQPRHRPRDARAGRRVAALHGWPDAQAPGAHDSRHPGASSSTPEVATGADPGRQRGRWRGQHHRDRRARSRLTDPPHPARRYRVPPAPMTPTPRTETP